MISSNVNVTEEVDKASKLMKKAREQSKPSVLSFRFKPDFDQVARYAKEAAVVLRRLPERYIPNLIEALQLSGEANEQMNMFNTAGIDFDELAECYIKLSKYTEAIEKFKYVRIYLSNGIYYLH